jgi:DNA (cytosine-5)-methyltransferase 1
MAFEKQAAIAQRTTVALPFRQLKKPRSDKSTLTADMVGHASADGLLTPTKQRSSAASKYFDKGLLALQAWKPGQPDVRKPVAQVIDMFCGCGGMSLGFAAMGQANGAYQLIGGIDINEASLRTYKHNFNVPAQKVDVRTLAKSKTELNNFLVTLPSYDAKLPTVLIGCAPCQGFTAHRKKNWDEPDARNDLVEAFADVAVSMMPDCVIMENVPELLSGRYWKHFEYLRDRLVNSGYMVKQAIHNAAAQGAPQERFRALVIAMRVDFAMPAPKFAPGEFRTVKDAISNLPRVRAGEQSATDPMHKSASHRASTIEVIKAIPKNGGSRPNGIGPKCLQDFKGFADVYGRLAWDRPAITITHYARNPASGRFVHPEQHRGLTMREAARLQSFPDGFEFTGGFDDVFRQIGEAVPPVLAVSIAASTLAALRGQLVTSYEELISSPVNNSFAGVIAGMKSARR